MIDFTIETEIGRPVSAVFALVSDPSKLAIWQASTVSAVQEDGGPLGLGTRVREVHRAPGGKQLTSRVEVSEYEEDRVFALQMIEGPLPIDARITFEPSERGTRLRFSCARPTDGCDATRAAAATPQPRAPVRPRLRDAQAGAREPHDDRTGRVIAPPAPVSTTASAAPRAPRRRRP